MLCSMTGTAAQESEEPVLSGHGGVHGAIIVPSTSHVIQQHIQRTGRRQVDREIDSYTEIERQSDRQTRKHTQRTGKHQIYIYIDK